MPHFFKPSPLRALSVSQVQQNQEFWRVFECSFRDAAAIAIQHAYRKKKGKLPGKLPAKGLRFLKEPMGTECRNYVKIIQRGQFEELNFYDPDFVRHVYKAFRFRLITINQLMDALLLYWALDCFKNPLKRHSFGSKGPYRPEEVIYATAIAMADFRRRQLEQESDYFSLNLNPDLVDGLFFYIFVENHHKLSSKWIELTKIYLERMKLTLPIEAQVIESLGQALYSDNLDQSSKAAIGLAKLIRAHSFLGKEVKGNAEFFESLISILSGIPSFELSPDFDPEDPKSPLLCFILLPIKTMMDLQVSVQGEDRIPPFMTAGKFGPRLIRSLDDNPQVFKAAGPSRPVEFLHPDLEYNTLPHGFQVSRFLVSWHDLVHCWIAGLYSVDEKNFNRYLRALITRATGFEMSKSIWELADENFPDAVVRKLCQKEKNDEGLMGHAWLLRVNMLKKAGRDFWVLLDKHDNNLLLIIDMIIHKEKWKELLFNTFYPEEFFATLKENIDVFISLNPKNLMKLQRIFQRLKHLIEEAPKVEEGADLFKHYIVLYRLGSRWNLYIALTELTTLFWARNEGLKFKGGKLLREFEESSLFQKLTSFQGEISEEVSYGCQLS